MFTFRLLPFLSSSPQGLHHDARERGLAFFGFAKPHIDPEKSMAHDLNNYQSSD